MLDLHLVSFAFGVLIGIIITIAIIAGLFLLGVLGAQYGEEEDEDDDA